MKFSDFFLEKVAATDKLSEAMDLRKKATASYG